MTSAARAAAVIVAAGRGERLGGPLPKAFVPVAGVPMLLHAARRVELSPLVDRIVVVVGAPDVDRARVLLAEHGLRKVASVVPGGTHRQDSVYAGLSQLDEVPVSVVHDGARPLVTPEVVTAVILAAAEAGAASAGLPVRETVKLIDGRDATQTLDRDQLWVAHTPQAFRTPLLKEAHRRARTDGFYGTDDAVLVERLGHAVRMIEDSPRNLKVTVPADLELAGVYLGERSGRGPHQDAPANSWGVGQMVRTGVGYDAHRLVMGRTLRLGGVEIPSPRGLAGHSDADVLVHAIMDALLGGAGLGDIGRHFPPGDPAYKDADSIELLRRVASLAADAGWRVLHVDSTVLAEAPRLAPHISKMQERLAAALGVDASAVNIKATTTEGMGAIGRGEGIAAHAVATLMGTGTRDQVK
ncbi:MAG: 2-C-methyl-D-erythritol 2,4-cyclodiphosphate synthase [Bacillati bacterium ANGP1]|uniref:Bifunctional enzyme IspD/IspF n=1 Tax=Candidatus Segetimicrobium genomatis TaxID=2569760 RepID=A0A537KUT5_9BACT|nr:MAG: 2-C-methyl-D-erythritol 2,4-cyclodiphosphate synthase [Terrabacteria group bacterium ANGP1]